MNPMKRLGVAAVVVAAMLLAGTSAQAKAPGGEDWSNWGTTQLTNVGDEPQAFGEATLTKVESKDTFVLHGDGGESSEPMYAYVMHTGVLTVSYQNLKPGETYWTPAGTFKVDRKGSGTVKGKVWFVIEYEYVGYEYVLTKCYVVDVIRLEPDGSGTAVLAGEFYPPWY
jgi:hypothetical protein